MKIALLLTSVLALSACGAAAGVPSVSPPSASATALASATSPAGSPGVTTPAATIAETKASANNATNAQLIAALTANGVPNPSQWAREVQEYRPYPEGDPTFAKLKSNLAKYNPSADTLTKILSSLSLP